MFPPLGAAAARKAAAQAAAAGAKTRSVEPAAENLV